MNGQTINTERQDNMNTKSVIARVVIAASLCTGSSLLAADKSWSKAGTSSTSTYSAPSKSVYTPRTQPLPTRSEPRYTETRTERNSREAGNDAVRRDNWRKGH